MPARCASTAGWKALALVKSTRQLPRRTAWCESLHWSPAPGCGASPSEPKMHCSERETRVAIGKRKITRKKAKKAA